MPFGAVCAWVVRRAGVRAAAGVRCFLASFNYKNQSIHFCSSYFELFLWLKTVSSDTFSVYTWMVEIRADIGVVWGLHVTTSQTSSCSAQVSFCRETGNPPYWLFFKSGFHPFLISDLKVRYLGGNVNVLVGVLQRNKARMSSILLANEANWLTRACKLRSPKICWRPGGADGIVPVQVRAQVQ